MQKLIRKLFALINLLRPQQYYKNVLILIGLVFSGNLLAFDLYPTIIIGFCLLCAMSSVNYILNDIRDREKDRLHPEKSNRPLASGEIPLWFAILLAVTLFFSSIGISMFLIPINSPKISYIGPLLVERFLFTISLLLIFISSFLYSFYFKQIIFADVSLVAINYVWRAVSGCYIINVRVSPWLIVIGFLFALFLTLSKRRGDLAYLGNDASSHRSVFDYYTLELLDQSITMIGASLLLSYAMYTFQGSTAGGIMILTVPIVAFLLLRYLYLLRTNTKLARKAERIFLDPSFVIGGFLVLVITVISLYNPDFVLFFLPTATP